MKEHPIIFSTAMVQAILADTKIQTRRLTGLDKVNEYPDEWFYNGFVGGDGLGVKNNLPASQHHMVHKSGKGVLMLNCPYGKKGDVLWVRESYSPDYFRQGEHGYKADWTELSNEYLPSPKWKPSIHMPRSAARIFIKVESVRVERLREISEKEAIMEGCIPSGASILASRDGAFYYFKSLWDKINGSRASWVSNPWVWVVEFSRIKD